MSPGAVAMCCPSPSIRKARRGPSCGAVTGSVPSAARAGGPIATMVAAFELRVEPLDRPDRGKSQAPAVRSRIADPSIRSLRPILVLRTGARARENGGDTGRAPAPSARGDMPDGGAFEP